MAAKHDIQNGITADLTVSRDEAAAACKRAAESFGEWSRCQAKGNALVVTLITGSLGGRLVGSKKGRPMVVVVRLRDNNVGGIHLDTAVEYYYTTQATVFFVPAGPKQLWGRERFFKFLDVLETELHAIDPNGTVIRRRPQTTGFSNTMTARTSSSSVSEAEFAEAGTPEYDELVAQADDEVSLLDLLLAASPKELPYATRKLLRVPLEVLPSHLGPDERVERVADAASGSIRGLLILTTKRLVLLDRVSGTIEVEIPTDDYTAYLGTEKSVLVWSTEGAARFMYMSPSSLEPQVDSDPGAAGSSETRPVPRLRVCSDCGGEFTPLLLRDSCPDCGGSLIWDGAMDERD